MDWLDDRAGFAASHARSIDDGRGWTRLAAARIGLAFVDVVPGDVESAASAAEHLLHDADWIGDLIVPLLAGLRADPAFVPPLRVHRDALRIGAVLHDDAHATWSASVLSADALARLPMPKTVVMGGRVSVVRYARAGGACLRTWEAPVPVGDIDAGTAPPCRATGTIALADGMVVRLDGRIRAHLIADATADVVMLTATLKAGAAAYAREYVRSDGNFVRAATLDDAESRTRMLLTLLRLSRRADAGPCFEAATRAASFALRWAAMREWLALDVAGALPRLREMAGDPNAEVRAAVTATLALVERRLAA